MRTTLLSACLISAAALLHAQSAKDPGATNGTRKVVQQTARILQGAKSEGLAEADKVAREKASEPSRVEQIAGEARAVPNPGAEERSLATQADQKINPVLRN